MDSALSVHWQQNLQSFGDGRYFVQLNVHYKESVFILTDSETRDNTWLAAFAESKEARISDQSSMRYRPIYRPTIPTTHAVSEDSSVVQPSAGLVIEISRSRVWVPAWAAGEFCSPGSTFCVDSYFGIPPKIPPPPPPHATAAAHETSRSFCQKCSWQVTAKRTCTLRMWLGAWLCGVYTTCAKTTAVPRGTSHVATRQRL